MTEIQHDYCITKDGIVTRHRRTPRRPFYRPVPCRAVRDRCGGHGQAYHVLKPCRLGDHFYGQPSWLRRRRDRD